MKGSVFTGKMNIRKFVYIIGRFFLGQFALDGTTK